MGTNYNPRIVTSGLVLALDAANVKSWPGSGSTWYDLSGNSNHCALSNTPTFSNGTATFDGTNNYGTITYNSSLNFSSGMTLMILLNSTGTTGRRNPWDQAYGGYGTWTDECASSSYNYYYGNIGGNTVPYTNVGSPTMARGSWFVAASIRNTTETRWFSNGTFASAVPNPYGTLAATTGNIRIGTGYAGFWQGSIAAVFAYTRGLTTSEITQNYYAIRGRYGI